MTKLQPSGAELQLSAMVIFIALAKVSELDAAEACRMLKLNWDQPLTDSFRDILLDAGSPPG
jgi:hypothetical protein